MKDPTSMGEVFLADPPARAEHVAAPARTRGWAVTGIIAALLGLVTIVVSLGLWDPDLDYSDPTAIAGRLREAQAQLIVMHVAMVTGMIALVVFALGLARRLNATLPVGSLLGGVAAAGIGLTAVANLLGSGLDTEFLFAADVVEKDVPETIAFYNHWIATIPWLWVGAGLTGVVLAIAALKHKAAPRWIGIVGLTLGGLTLLLGISPLQYMAGFLGPIWLLVTAIGFTVGDKAYRNAAA
ncbi:MULTISPECIES: hypothetical protein [Mumia]|uniref:hypothetical protein n=1 Tax=Mumia TaxID=1546255 RepID=UPI001AB0445E|nr:hypothetical protein [Mumia sp. ZJ430]